MCLYKHILWPILRLLPPERAHACTIAALKAGITLTKPVTPSPALAQELFGLKFANPLGMAAGFDKNAEVTDPLLSFGVGFVEAGTVTPLPQSGNPKPRMFRLENDQAIINRLGFNNKGLDYFTGNLKKRKQTGIVGANVGKNKSSDDVIADYTAGLKAVFPYADYVTINISSPNTEGLRDLQSRKSLKPLLQALTNTRDTLTTSGTQHFPLLLKIAPDLTDEDKQDIATIVMESGIDGIIISNTTIARLNSLKSPYVEEQGGLSGKPLFSPSTKLLSEIYILTEGKIPLIGVGGIASAEDAYRKILAGASLVQLYTALIYQGPGLISQIINGIAHRLAKDGFSSISEAIGADARQ